MADWTKYLDEDELKTLIPANAAGQKNEELTGARIQKDLFNKGVYPPIKAAMSSEPRPSAIALINAQLKDLICTDSKEYAAVRKQLAVLTSKNTYYIVGAIATAINREVGLTVAFCVPFTSVLLLAMMQVGKNAYCQSLMPSEKAPKKKKRTTKKKTKRSGS